MPRGRWPAAGFLKIKSVSTDGKKIQFDRPLPKTVLGGKDTELVVLENWSIAREIVASSSGNLLEAATPVGWRGHCSCLAKPGMSAFLEHSLDFIKEPGRADDAILYWHTYNSIDHSEQARETDYRELPAEFHPFFQGEPLSTRPEG